MKFIQQNKENGFTLIEVLVVVVIIAIMTTLLARNFSGQRTQLRDMTNIMTAEIRAVQQKAIAGLEYPNNDPSPGNTGLPVPRCGYGVTLTGTTTTNEYIIYVAPRPFEDGTPGNNDNDNCAGLDTRFDNQGSNPFYRRDEVVGTKRLLYEGLEFKTVFYDIFFEPPGPKIYINNDASINGPPSIITIGQVGQACSQTNCSTICVYPSGAIESIMGTTCP